MTRVAAIDCGTNSIRLLVADADPDGGVSAVQGGAGAAGAAVLKDLDRRMTIVRLGQGVDRTGRLAPDALERTFAACREYAAVIGELGAEGVRFVATSATTAGMISAAPSPSKTDHPMMRIGRDLASAVVAEPHP